MGLLSPVGESGDARLMRECHSNGQGMDLSAGETPASRSTCDLVMANGSLLDRRQRVRFLQAILGDTATVTTPAAVDLTPKQRQV